MSSSVLFVEDDQLFREAVADHFAEAGILVEGVGTLADARERMRETRFGLLILDDQLPDGRGVSLLEDSEMVTPALIVTGYPAVSSAVAGLRHGIQDYLEKPVELDVLRRRVLELLPRGGPDGPDDTLLSRAARAVHEAVRRAGGSRSPVLLTGETGTGKSYLARAIHRGTGADLPFVQVNCAALPEALIEAELFGTESGAFTGARAKEGLMEAAGRGTIFLDEIGEMPVTVQAKLLQCLESSELRRVGGVTPRPLRARIIAATNVDLDEAVSEGRFRADLRYRLEVLTIRVPALRERIEDLPGLARALLASMDHPPGVRVPESEIEALKNHEWPGNIRELRNVLERSLVYAEGGIARPSVMVAQEVRDEVRLPAGPPAAGTLPPLPLDELEREQIFRTLKRWDGHRENTARALGIGVATLRRKLNVYREAGFADRIAQIDQSKPGTS